MPRGGKRERSGRKKGGRNQETLNKQAAEEAYRAFLQAHHQRLWTAALEAACGSFVLMRRTAAGVVQVTDPHEMATLLAQPSSKGRDPQWYLEVRKPDATLMKELHHRLMGPPTQMIELSATEPMRISIVHQQLGDDPS
jgi:hypothetical protein